MNIVVDGPSGSGKSSCVLQLKKEHPELVVLLYGDPIPDPIALDDFYQTPCNEA
jgi:deoxyadenosine/deoxycytidine kinase